MEQNVPLQQHREAISLRGMLYDWLDSVVFALVVVMIFNVGFRIVNVSGDSMLPTLHTGDRLIISRIGYQPQVGDIIVSVQDNTRHEPVIKRIIALEGQTVDVDTEAGIVYVDGQALDDSYTLQPGLLLPMYENPVSFPVEVPQGCVFVMGDNRNNSLDSRSYSIGMIQERYILGKAVFCIFPFDRIGVPD